MTVSNLVWSPFIARLQGAAYASRKNAAGYDTECALRVIEQMSIILMRVDLPVCTPYMCYRVFLWWWWVDLTVCTPYVCV